MSLKTIAIIANSLHSKKIASIENELNSAAIDNAEYSIELFKSSPEKSIRQIASDAALNHEVLIAVGGDGTFHEIVNGIFDAGKADTCLMGFMAVGSANDFQKTLNFESSLKSILVKLKAQVFRKVNVGCVLFTSENGKKEKRYFLNIASLGMGYEVMKAVNRDTQKLNADFSYFKAIAKTFTLYKNKEVACKADDWHWEGKVKLIAIANGKYFGSGLCIAPNASPFKKDLAITIVGDVSLWTYLKNLLPLKLGRYINHEQVFYKKVVELQVDSKQVLGIEADGEVLGTTPAIFTIIEEAINIIY